MYTRDGSGGFSGCSDFPTSRSSDRHLRGAPSCLTVNEQRPSDVLGALPRRRPQRRSAKRAAPANAASATKVADAPAQPAPTKPAPTKAKPRAKRTPSARPTAPRMHQPAQPAGVPPTPRDVRPEDPSSRHLVGTAAQAAAELAEIGLSVSARALRRFVDRLPRP